MFYFPTDVYTVQGAHPKLGAAIGDFTRGRVPYFFLPPAVDTLRELVKKQQPPRKVMSMGRGVLNSMPLFREA